MKLPTDIGHLPTVERQAQAAALAASEPVLSNGRIVLYRGERAKIMAATLQALSQIAAGRGKIIYES